jgi:uncharacterized membrane protein
MRIAFLLLIAVFLASGICALAQEVSSPNAIAAPQVAAGMPAKVKGLKTEVLISSQNPVEKFILNVMNYVVYFSQILATFVITIGMIKALWTFIKDAMLGRESMKAIRESRIELGHSFSLGLGFLIGASILKTAAAPNWDDIGKLSVIIAIRTILNFFLTMEIKRRKSFKPKVLLLQS